MSQVFFMFNMWSFQFIISGINISVELHKEHVILMVSL